jgi:type II secretory pathway pseudopilin PulG
MDKRVVNELKRSSDCRERERGFSLLQILVVVAIVGIVTSFALVSIARARENIRLQSSIRQLASYIERARLDSIRRHATGTELASVAFTNTLTYSVKMDFDGMGNITTRSFSLEDGVSVFSTPLPSLSFNWRGRTSACTTTFALETSGGLESTVDVSDAGDVTINGDVDVLPTVSYANVNSTSDIASGTVVSGTTVRTNSVDCSSTDSGTPAPPITGTGTTGGTTCSMTATPSAVTVKKGGGTTGTIAMSITGSGSYTITPSGPSNLQLSPTSKTLSGGGSASFTVKSLNNTRGTFAVNFASSCTTVTVLVKVTN